METETAKGVAAIAGLLTYAGIGLLTAYLMGRWSKTSARQAGDTAVT